MSDDPRIAAFVRELEELRSEVKALKTPQLAHSAIVDGALAGWDDTEQIETMQIGLQYDGTNTAASLTGPKPPTPDAPMVAPGQNSGVVVTWNGIFVDGAVAPMDYARMDVHVGDAGVDETYPIANSILSARGGDAFVSLDPGTYWVVLVARAQNGKASVPSEAVSFTVASPSLSDGEAPDAVATVTAQPMLGAVALRWAAVENADPVTYKVYGKQLDDGETTFAIDEDLLVAETGGAFVVVRALADETPLGYEETTVEQVTVDTMNREAGGYVNCLTPQAHPWGPGDTVEIAGVEDHPEINGAWPITTIDFFGTPNQNFFQIRPTETATPFANYDPTATASRTVTRTASYGFRVVAIDADGASSASPMISCAPARVTSDDIAAYSITAEMLQAGSVTAESLAAEIILATRFITAETGARVEFGPAGLAIYAPDGSVAFNFPTFSTNPEDPLTATVRAEIDALSIAVQDYLTLNGQENQINKGARLRLSTGTTRPSKSSTPVVSWDSKPSHVGLGGRGLIKVGAEWYMVEYGCTIARMAETADRFVLTGRWGSTTSGVGSSTTASSVVYIAGSLWVMTLANDPANQYYNHWRVRRFTYNAGTDAWTQVGTGWRFNPNSLSGWNGKGTPILYTDGTDLFAVQTNKNGHVNVWTATTAAPASWTQVGAGLYSSLSVLWQPQEEMRGAVYGTEHAHPRSITQYSRPASTPGTNQTITFTTSAAHGFFVGQKVKIASSVFAGDASIGSIPNSTTFTFHSTSGTAGTSPLVGTVQPYVLYTTREGKTGNARADAWVQRLGGEWINSPQDTFDPPVGSGSTGIAWDPALSVLRSRFGETIYTHTNLSWTDEPSRWWSALTLYRGSGPYETEMGPKTQFTPPKRAKVTLSHPTLPPASIPPSSADPTAYRVYLGRGASEPSRTTMDRIDEVTVSPGKTVISTMPGFPAAPTNYPPLVSDTPFPASTPAEISPAPNIGPAFLRGDGTSWLDPFGAMQEYGGTALPEGWLWADGSAVSQTLYPRLYEAIGTRWNVGGEAAGTFRLPKRIGSTKGKTLFTTHASWTNDGFWEIVDGIVIFSGKIQRTTGTQVGANALPALPIQARPEVDVILTPDASATTRNSQANYIHIAAATGVVTGFMTTATNNAQLYVSSLSYRAVNWLLLDGSNYIIRAA